MENNQYGHIALNTLGLKFRYDFQSKKEGDTYWEFIKTKQKHTELTMENALSTLQAVGLGDKVANEFDKTIKKEKRNSILGFVAGAGVCMLLNNYDLHPIVERVGYTGAIVGIASDVINYTKAYIAEILYVNRYLRRS